jgi:Flp pilus assembly protein TadG
MFDQKLGVLTPRLRARWDAYAEDNRGAAAVEFAMISLPFFFLIFGLMEVCLLFIMSTVLEHSISEASRQIRTGQAQQGGFTEVAFRQLVCDQLFDLLDCDSKLYVDVQELANFGSANMDLPFAGNGSVDDSGFGFNPGGPNEIVAVRAFYEWELMTPIMSAPLANMPGSKHLIQANSVFRNEPFGD